MKATPNISLQAEAPFCGVCNSDDAAPLQITPPRTLVNGSTKGTYTPAAWPVRAGGSDHLQHASKGF